MAIIAVESDSEEEEDEIPSTRLIQISRNRAISSVHELGVDNT